MQSSSLRAAAFFSSAPRIRRKIGVGLVGLLSPLINRRLAGHRAGRICEKRCRIGPTSSFHAHRKLMTYALGRTVAGDSQARPEAASENHTSKSIVKALAASERLS
jgi:hypothetical protein